MRTRTPGLALAGLLLLGCTPPTDGPTQVQPADRASLPAPSDPSPSPPAPLAVGALLPPLPSGAPVPLTTGLQQAVARALEDPALAGGLAVSVVDTASGQILYERAAATPLLPASTAKIATAVAVLTALDPGTRLTTRVVAGSEPGQVVLVGGGDPTLAGPDAAADYPAPARLSDLARRARLALGSVAVTQVVVDDTLYSGPPLGPGWRPGYVTQGSVAPVTALMVDGGRARPDRSARVADPALAAGEALAGLLQPGATVARGTAPVGATELARVDSQPVGRLVERMLTRSDNDLAEALARQVALARGLPASFEGTATALRQQLASLGVEPDAVALADGSGLSRQDRLQPTALTRLLTAVASGQPPALAPVLSGLPVAGFDGTLAGRYRPGASAAPAAGVVRAKTGTLDGVSALAGLVRTADGRLLAFDLTATAVPTGQRSRAESALDTLAAALAACGCR